MSNDARLMLRLPDELHRALAALAKANERSLNGEIVFLLTNLMGMATAPWATPEFTAHVRRLRADLLPIAPADRQQVATGTFIATITEAGDGGLPDDDAERRLSAGGGGAAPPALSEPYP